MCNYKAKGDIILHFGANKTIQGIIQGIIFINLKKKTKKKNNWVKKHIFLALNLRAKFRPKIGKIRQNRTGWQVWMCKCQGIKSFMINVVTPEKLR
jgi:hypothetical protein